MAGYSLAGTTAKGVGHPLFARALYIDGGVGQMAALCFVDLWCASRYLLHQAAAYTLTGRGVQSRGPRPGNLDRAFSEMDDPRKRPS
jgi:hypothetical protein